MNTQDNSGGLFIIQQLGCQFLLHFQFSRRFRLKFVSNLFSIGNIKFRTKMTGMQE